MSDLTKPIVIQTKVPAPSREHPVKFDGDVSTSPATPLIELRACSELTEYASAVDHFSSGGRIKTVQGFQGEPVVFAINNENVCILVLGSARTTLPLNCKIYNPNLYLSN
jgi:hypothetical protein